MSDKTQSVSELAKKWKMSSTMVRRLAQQDRLPGTTRTPGGHYRIPSTATAPKSLKPGPKTKTKK